MFVNGCNNTFSNLPKYVCNKYSFHDLNIVLGWYDMTNIELKSLVLK